MCTLLTFTTTQWNADMESRIYDDFKGNDDGSVLMLADSKGRIYESIKTFNVARIIETLNNDLNWSRCFLHNRFATQGAKNINNIHGWQHGSMYWFHNGTLIDQRATRFPVDSMLIGHWIAQYGAEETVEHISDKEPFANVIILDTSTDCYYIARSKYGQLYTDNLGNFSTNKVGAIAHPVLQGYGKYDIRTGLYEKHAFFGDLQASLLPPEDVQLRDPEEREIMAMTEEEFDRHLKTILERAEEEL